jgi:hypothetical protein
VQLNAVAELKHSIQTHVTICGGPTPDLALYLLKVVDLLEDTDTERRERETLALAMALTESVAMQVTQSIDERARKAEILQQPFPPKIKQAGDMILMTMGKCRSLPDKIGAKNSILASVASALRELAAFTHATYPAILDSSRNQL